MGNKMETTCLGALAVSVRAAGAVLASQENSLSLSEALLEGMPHSSSSFPYPPSQPLHPSSSSCLSDIDLLANLSFQLWPLSAFTNTNKSRLEARPAAQSSLKYKARSEHVLHLGASTIAAKNPTSATTHFAFVLKRDRGLRSHGESAAVRDSRTARKRSLSAANRPENNHVGRRIVPGATFGSCSSFKF